MYICGVDELLNARYKTICRKIAGNSLLGDDLYQHCILSLLEKNLSAHPNIGGYFYLTAISEWRSPYKSFRKLYDSCGNVDIDQCTGLVDINEGDNIMNAAMEIFDSLPSEEKGLIAATLLIGNSEAIAEQYDLSSRTVRYNLAQIRNRCKKELEALLQ